MSKFLSSGFDHPCKQTCSGWQQGRERGWCDIVRTAEFKAIKTSIKSLRDTENFNKNEFCDHVLKMILSIEKLIDTGKTP